MDLPPSSQIRAAWVTGARGLIGNYLVQEASRSAPEWKIIPLTRERLDLADFKKTGRAFAADRPGLIIHCAALSRPAECQANPTLARQINVEVTARLAHLASAIPLLFFSSDLVFDGSKGNYTESDPVNPLIVYAETKAAAEEIVLRNPKHLVIRTSLNGGRSPTGDRAFNEDMLRGWKAGRTLQLFIDKNPAGDF